MGDATRRLFFALWPEDPVRTLCDWYASSLLGKRIKRVPAANFHITLGFAGSVSNAVSRCLEVQADAIKVAPFQLTIDQLGYWQRQRVLWMGPRHTPEELWALSSAVSDVLVQCGVQPERPAWQAHMTLARKLSQPPPPAESPAIEWSVRHFCLLQSVNTESGVSYRVLRNWTLGGG